MNEAHFCENYRKLIYVGTEDGCQKNVENILDDLFQIFLVFKIKRTILC